MSFINSLVNYVLIMCLTGSQLRFTTCTLSQLTTPGKQFSVSRLGPSSPAGVDPPEESDEESGDEGIELFNVPILAVINCNK